MATYGLMKLTEFLNAWWQVKNGAVKIWYLTLNHRLKKFIVKPTNNRVAFANMTFPFSDRRLIFEGHTPTAVYDQKTAQQINMKNLLDKPKIDPRYIDNLLKLFYNLGKSDTGRDNLQLYVLVAAGASVLSLVMQLHLFSK